MKGIRGLVLAFIVALVAGVAISNSFAVQNRVVDVVVKEDTGKLRLEIVKEGNIEIGLFRLSDPDRLVINCIGAKYEIPWQVRELNNPYAYRIRTSQFKEDPVGIVRVVLDLKKNVDYKVETKDRLAIVDVSDGKGQSEQTSAYNNSSKETSSSLGKASITPALSKASMGPVLPVVKSDEVTGDKKDGNNKKEVSPVDSKSSGKEVERIEDASSNSPWIVETRTDVQSVKAPRNPLEDRTKVSKPDVVTENDSEPNPWTEYAGGAPATGYGMGMAPRRITIDAQGADIKTVLRTISDFAGKNIVYGPDVKGKVYVHIKDVPWEEALDVLLKAHGYAYREEYGMIRVAEASRLMKEELEAQTAERKKEELLPLVTKIIFVNNSNAEELKDALQNIVSSRGKIDVDRGSNALIVNDIERNIEKIEEMVRALDRKTYQVDINAKLAEVDVEATRELGINWGLLNLHASGFSGMGSASVNSDISLSAGTLKFGTVRSWGEINAILEMLEQSNKANIISNPRITTMDNREASILVGKEIPLIVADEAGNPITELTKIGIMLRVVPHVNADKTITLDLHPEVSELQSESTAQGGVIISTSEADTRVVVRNGETAVIGGLIKKVKTDLRRGVPILKDIPIIGGLFSSNSTADKKQELVIFVTPTIVE